MTDTPPAARSLTVRSKAEAKADGLTHQLTRPAPLRHAENGHFDGAISPLVQGGIPHAFVSVKEPWKPRPKPEDAGQPWVAVFRSPLKKIRSECKQWKAVAGSPVCKAPGPKPGWKKLAAARAAQV